MTQDTGHTEHNTFRKHLGCLYTREEAHVYYERCQLQTKSPKQIKGKICSKLTLKILEPGQ